MKSRRKPRKPTIPLSQRLLAWVIMILTVALVWVLLEGNAVADVSPIPPWENEQMKHGYPWATITGSRVNMRTGPGTEYKSVAQWGVGTAVEVVRVEGEWAGCLHWAHLDRTVWIHTDYLDMVE